MASNSPISSIIPITPDDAEAQLRAMLGLGPSDPLPVATPAVQSDDQSQDKTSDSSLAVGPPVKSDQPKDKDDDLESALITAPSSAQSGQVNSKIAAPTATPQGPALSPDVIAAQNNLTNLKAQGSGVSHKHGFLGGLLKVGDIAGSILAPGAMSVIPGTTLNYAAKVNNAQQGVNQALGSQIAQTQLATDQANLNSKLNPPDKTKPASIIRNPVTAQIEGIDNGDGTFMSPSSQGFPQSLKDIIAKETPKTSESSPLGDKAAQVNQMLQNRYQVLNPGKALPPEYSLTGDSTQKDYDRVDKALEATEKAMGTKAQQDQANEFRKQTVAIQQQTAAAKNQKQSVEEQSIEAAAQSLAKMDPNDLSSLKDIASLRGDQRLLIYNRAKQINPNFNTSEVNRKIKMMDNFTNGADGKSLQSFGTFLEHAGTASDVVNSIRNTNMPIINKPLNWLAKNAAGDANYVQLLAALEPVKTEAENFMLNGHAMHVEDKKSIDTILSADSSPAQIQAAIKQLGHTVQARYNEMDNRYNGVMKQHLPPDSLSDEARAGAGKIGLNLGGQPQQQGNAQANGAVPSGATGKAKGSDGQWHYHDKSGNDLGVVK